MWYIKAHIQCEIWLQMSSGGWFTCMQVEVHHGLVSSSHRGRTSLFCRKSNVWLNTPPFSLNAAFRETRATTFKTHTYSLRAKGSTPTFVPWLPTVGRSLLLGPSVWLQFCLLSMFETEPERWCGARSPQQLLLTPRAFYSSECPVSMVTYIWPSPASQLTGVPHLASSREENVSWNVCAEDGPDAGSGRKRGFQASLSPRPAPFPSPKFPLLPSLWLCLSKSQTAWLLHPCTSHPPHPPIPVGSRGSRASLFQRSAPFTGPGAPFPGLCHQ